MSCALVPDQINTGLLLPLQWPLEVYNGNDFKKGQYNSRRAVTYLLTNTHFREPIIPLQEIPIEPLSIPHKKIK